MTKVPIAVSTETENSKGARTEPAHSESDSAKADEERSAKDDASNVQQGEPGEVQDAAPAQGELPEARTETDAESADAGQAIAGDDAEHAAATDNALREAQAALEAMQAERDKAREALLRATADIDNNRKRMDKEFDKFRQRMRREVDEAKMHGKDDAVREFLPVIDNLERAVQVSENATDVASVIEGVRMVLKLFDDTARRMGLNRVPGVGSRFDPAIHNAIQQVEHDEHAPGTIVTEVAAGYMFGQRLIRAATVVVAKEPAPKTTPPEPDVAGSDATAEGAPAPQSPDSPEQES